MNQNPLEAIEPWKERWQEGRTGWDQGRPHDQLSRLLQHAQDEGRLPAGAKIFSAGCGRAHNEAWLAHQGFYVDAVDAVPDAIAEAQKLYAAETRLHLAVADVFGAEDGKTYDAIFDRAMLCALQPQHREAYITKIWGKLLPGGLVMSLPFRVTRGPGGPPFPVDEAEAQRLFQDRFDLCYAGSAPPLPNPQNVLEEWLCIWRKRSV